MGAVVPSSASIKGYANMGNAASADQGTGRMNMFDLANLLDQDGNLQNEMMVMAFAATMLATIPVLLGNEFDVNVGLRKKRGVEEKERLSLPSNLDDAEKNLSLSGHEKVSNKYQMARKEVESFYR